MTPYIYLAAEDGPHVSLKAESLFEIGGVMITNAVLYGLIIFAILAFVGIRIARKATIKPKKGAVAIFEMVTEALINMMEGIFHDQKKAIKYTPVFGTFFILIVISYITGILPYVGVGITYNGAPLFRAFIADLNGTIAMAVAAILLVQYYSIQELGLLGHFRHYFTDKPLNPMNLFIGLLEVFGEFTRIMSLSLRLFLNTAVGEILIAVFAFVGGYFASFTAFPIVIFEILVALIQAYVFTVLSATYLALAISHQDGEHQEDHHASAQLSPDGAKA